MWIASNRDLQSTLMNTDPRAQFASRQCRIDGSENSERGMDAKKKIGATCAPIYFHLAFSRGLFVRPSLGTKAVEPNVGKLAGIFA